MGMSLSNELNGSFCCRWVLGRFIDKDGSFYFKTDANTREMK